MLLLNKELISKLLRQSSGAVAAIALWADDIQRSQWRTREDVLKTCPDARFVAGSMAIFPFDSERYSVTAQIAFNTAVVIVLAVSANSNTSREVR